MPGARQPPGLCSCCFYARNALPPNTHLAITLSFPSGLLKTLFCNEDCIDHSIHYCHCPSFAMRCQLLLPNSTFPPWRIPLSNILDHLLCFSSIFYLPLPEYKLQKSRTFCVLSQVPRIVPNIQRRSAKNVLMKPMKGYMTSTVIWWQIHRGQEPKKCSCSRLLHTRPNRKYQLIHLHQSVHLLNVGLCGFFHSNRAVKSAGSETQVPGSWAQRHHPRTW